MANYLIKLKLTIGEYEKTSKHLVEAPDMAAAEKQAIENEAHGDLDWDDCGAYDMGGEMYYGVLSGTLVADEDVAALRRYL